MAEFAMESEAAQTMSLRTTCRCGKAHLSFAVPWSSLPLRAEACHCSDCRLSTGAIPAIYVLTPGAPQPEESLPEAMSAGTLRKYVSGPKYTRWFCGECGTHIAISNDSSPVHWSCSAGAIATFVDAPSGQRVRTSDLKQHQFVKTEDGIGVSHTIDDGVPRFLDDAETPTPAEALALASSTGSVNPGLPTDALTLLPLRCHCGSFRAAIRRPSTFTVPEGSARCTWNDRWMWGFCVCNDCRRSAGFPVSAYAFVSTGAVVPAPDSGTTDTNVSFPSTSSTDPFALPGLVTYLSSHNVRRAFCGTCGASVFYQFWRSDAPEMAKHTDILDVHLGVLNTAGGMGIAYRDWLWRRPRVANTRHAEDRELAEAVSRGLEKIKEAP